MNVVVLTQECRVLGGRRSQGNLHEKSSGSSSAIRLFPAMSPHQPGHAVRVISMRRDVMFKAVKFAALAAVLATTVGTMPAAAYTTGKSARAFAQTETVRWPMNQRPGCWTDEGYGRFSSCDTQ